MKAYSAKRKRNRQRESEKGGSVRKRRYGTTENANANANAKSGSHGERQRHAQPPYDYKKFQNDSITRLRMVVCNCNKHEARKAPTNANYIMFNGRTNDLHIPHIHMNICD